MKKSSSSLETLFARYQAGEEKLINLLLEELRQQIFAYFSLRYAHYPEADDSTQELLIALYENLNDYADSASLLTGLLQQCSEQARQEKPESQAWSSSALEELEAYLQRHDEVAKTLHEIFIEAHERFEIKDHVRFCFSVALKSLFPEEHDFFILHELFGLELAHVAQLYQREVQDVYRVLEETREDLAQRFADTCGLQGRDASCQQCVHFSEWLAGDEESKRAEQIAELGFSKEDDEMENLDQRLDIVRESLTQRDRARHFHQALYELLRRLREESSKVLVEFEE